MGRQTWWETERITNDDINIEPKVYKITGRTNSNPSTTDWIGTEWNAMAITQPIQRQTESHTQHELTSLQQQQQPALDTTRHEWI